MHDGYVFILGVCGSASDSGPAPAVLDGLLAALPPVKRAAYLAEVLVHTAAPSLHDPLIAVVAADLIDAEVLLIVTPLPGGHLPTSLRSLAAILPAAPQLGQRFVVLVGVGRAVGDPFQPLREQLERSGGQIVGTLYAPAERSAEAIIAEALVFVQAAYQAARAEHPEALPQ